MKLTKKETITLTFYDHESNWNEIVVISPFEVRLYRNLAEAIHKTWIESPEQKVKCIKRLRSYTNFGLRLSKHLVEKGWPAEETEEYVREETGK